jgi:DNA segregation ATPase FtsK/SpoIIIE, S-DNA-T family
MPVANELEIPEFSIVAEDDEAALAARPTVRRRRTSGERTRMVERGRTRRGESAEYRAQLRLRREVGGVALVVVGLMALFAASVPSSGWLPGIIKTLLSALVGNIGSAVVALGLMALGVAMLVGHRGFRPTAAAMGMGILFLAFLGLLQIGVPKDGFTDRIWLREPGGLIGLFFAEAIKPLLGRMWGAVVLVASSLCAVTLISNVPLSVLIQRILRTFIFVGAPAGRWVGAHLHRRSQRLRLEKTAARGIRTRREPVRAEAKKTDAIVEATPALPLPAPEPTAAPKAAKPPAIREPRKHMVKDDKQLPLPVEEMAEAAEQEDIEAATEEVLNNLPATDFVNYSLPPMNMLSVSLRKATNGEQEDTVNKMETLEQTLASFGVQAKVVEIERGPRVTRYEIRLPRGIRVSRITNLADDIALSLAALDVRVEAPVPGKGVIGIEVPNAEAVFVDLAEILSSNEATKNKSPIGFALGKDITGYPRMADLAKMPHLLIAGATNSGKSVCLNAIIMSILCRAKPDEVKLLLIDPKRVEMTLFEGLPHLVAPVAHDVKQAAGLLRWAIRQMEHRYEVFSDLGVRNIVGYNERAQIDDELEKMHYLVIVIDELADLMMQAKGEFEASICRLAQLARATGIHLVVATQRPSVNVITGTIKANIPSRIAFNVASQADSRVILDMNGAERLVGSGDMLYLAVDAAKPLRIQGAYVTEKDINKIVKFLKQQAKPEYSAEALAAEEAGVMPGANKDEIEDELFDKALEYVISTKYASASMLQRRMRIGYTRAARLIDMMQERGYIGPADGSKPREVYISPTVGMDNPTSMDDE